MPSTTDLQRWVRAQYQTYGVDQKGQYIGNKRFKNLLIGRYPTVNGERVPKLEMRQLVNRGAYLPERGTPENTQRPHSAPLSTERSNLGPVDNSVVPNQDNEITAEPFGIDANHSIENKVLSPEPLTAAQSNELDTTVRVPNGTFEVHVSLNPRLQELQEFTQNSLGSNRDEDRPLPTLEDQRYLLQSNDDDEHIGEETIKDDIEDAAVFSADVLNAYDMSLLPQHGLLGTTSLTGQMSLWSTSVNDSRLFHNTNIPISVFVCGLQGSGKSHTLSCLIENYLIQTPMLGNLRKQLSALVFHFSQYTSYVSFRPCEAAFLGCPSRQFPSHPCVAPVNVLVAPSNYQNLQASYSQIPGVKVQPFRLRPRDLNVSSMLTLMSVDQSQSAPLYIGQITKILREMASISPKGFDYAEFKRRLQGSKLSRGQQGPLQQRLELLESFLILDESAPSWDFESGGATIIDLSCPFVDANMACVLFNIGMSLYLESGLTTGKVIAMDEAHKYITDTPASKALTESLLSVIRQQRHFGVRVIISTQEPTISPRLMDLCSTTVVHRFTSPEWFSVLRRHILMEEENKSPDEIFRRILNLRVGEALLFAPSALLCRANQRTPERLGSDLLQIKVRKRVTWDGGKSILCM